MTKTLVRLHLKPTGADVLKLYDEMLRQYHIPVADKQTAPEMRFVASALESFGIINAQRFLREFSTYIFHKVYLPFSPSYGTKTAMQISAIVHEYGHAYQDERAGSTLSFELNYLNPERRAVLEAECYALEACLALRYPRAGFARNPLDHYIALFSASYGALPRTAVERFTRELRRRVERYAQNQQPFNQHQRVVTAFLDRRLIHC